MADKGSDDGGEAGSQAPESGAEDAAKPKRRSTAAPQRLGMREIARRAGVAPMTVSRALADPDKVSPETRARIMAVVEREGFIRNQLASSMS